jgi:CRP/FNR family transcriptional regulator, polysaccharide utilization system transcription regulator
MVESLEKTSCIDCKHCNKKNQLFSLLNKSELEKFNSARVEVSFKKNEMIYKQGMPLTHLVFIHKGFGKIYIEGPLRKNLIICFTQAYDLNGGIGVFLDQIHHSSLQAADDCETCLIDINAFNDVIKNNPAFREAYLKFFSERALQIFHRFAVLTQKNIAGRMAEAILYLRKNLSNNSSITNISKADLAEYTAMSKESAIRVLKEFQDENYIGIKDQIIHILNDEALQKISLHG